MYINVMAEQQEQKNQNKDDKTIALEIKSLESEYETVLRQYEEAYQTYLTYIDHPETEYTQLKARAFWGTAGVKEDAADSVEACQDMCAAADTCTGATFNANKRYCWMRSGESAIVTGRDADVALIPKSRELLLQLTFYNKKLMKINHKLAEYYSNLPQQQTEAIKSTADKHAMLIQYNEQLQSEQDMLLTEEQKLETINASRNTQDIVATQGYTQFRFWMLIAAILLILSMKMALAVNEDGSPSREMSIVVPVVILMLLGASFMLRTPQGFMIFGLIIFGLIAVKMLS